MLESHSLKMVLARFHLATPHAVREIRTRDEARDAHRQINVLERELTVIKNADTVDYGELKALGFDLPAGVDTPAIPASEVI